MAESGRPVPDHGSGGIVMIHDLDWQPTREDYYGAIKEMAAAGEAEVAKREKRIAELETAVRALADDDTYLRHLSEWHDVGHMQRGVQAIARAALEKQ